MEIRGMLRKGAFFWLLAFCTAFSAAPAGASETTETTTESTAETTTATTVENTAETTTESSAAAETTVKKGLVKEGKYYYYYKNGKAVKNRWVKYNGAKYYFNEKGRAVTHSKKIKGKLYVFSRQGKLLTSKKARIVSVGKYSYYVSKKGIASTGWFTVKGKLYYADSKGRLYKNKTKNGIKFTKTGAAKSNTYSELKILTMKIVSKITNSSMTKKQKLKACWNYVITHTVYATKNPDGKTGWQQRLAYSCLKYGRGSCSGFACAFAALAAEIGYNPYVIRGRVPGTRDGAADGMTRHTWVMINGLYYDPEAQYAGWMKGVYASSTYPITHTVSSRTRYKL